MKEKHRRRDDNVTILKLDSTNTEFFLKNGFLGLSLKEDGSEKMYDRVFLHRIFPFEKLNEYISVLDESLSEIGIIYDICDFSDETKEVLETELERKYYSPKIKTIVSLKERYGFSYWKIVTDDNRNISVTVQDTYRNMIRVGEDKVIILDVDGNRFVIESIAALDRKSYKRIELYL